MIPISCRSIIIEILHGIIEELHMGSYHFNNECGTSVQLSHRPGKKISSS